MLSGDSHTLAVCAASVRVAGCCGQALAQKNKKSSNHTFYCRRGIIGLLAFALY